MEDERKTRPFHGYDIVYHKSYLKCTERPGDDPECARTFDPDPAYKEEFFKKGQVYKDYTVPCDFRIMYNLEVPMRDGIKIYCDVYLPIRKEKVPGIVIWTPFGKAKEFMAPPPHSKTSLNIDGAADNADKANIQAEMARMFGKTSPWSVPHGPDTAFWLENGYAMVICDPRGACNSEGDGEYFGRGQDSDDFYDAVQWVSEQDWCNGKVATTGCSWLAISGWYMAAKQPPALACIAPFEGHGNMYRDEYVRMGIMDVGFARNYYSPGKTWQEDIREMMRRHPYYDDFWEDKRAPFEDIKCPAYVLAGYFSYYHPRGTFEGFRRLGSKEKWLIVHESNNVMLANDPEFCKDLLKFFDHYCKGIDNGWEKTPRCRVSVLDPKDGNIAYRPEADWPIPRRVRTDLWLDASNGTLSKTKPEQEASVAYDCDVEHKFYDSQREATEKDNTEGRAEFTYVFDEDTEITGDMNLYLWVEADGNDDMDLFVRVMMCDENGNYNGVGGEHNYGYAGPDNRLRVSLRALDTERSTEEYPEQSFRKPEKLSAGEIVPVVIPLWPTGLKFHKGQQLKLIVAGYDYCGHPLPGGEETRLKPNNKGKHIIHTGGKYAARLNVPVIPSV